MTTAQLGVSTIFRDLTAVLTGRLILPEDAAYGPARQLWNGKVNKRPAALVRCANIQDVVHTVRWTRSNGMLLSVPHVPRAEQRKTKDDGQEAAF